MILTQSQAEAVYCAMCALNNINARIDVTIPLGNGLCIKVFETPFNSIRVIQEYRDKDNTEIYITQNEFAVAYGVN